MLKFLTDISRTLDASNIDHAIQTCEAALSNAPAELKAENALELMTSLKLKYTFCTISKPPHFFRVYQNFA